MRTGSTRQLPCGSSEIPNRLRRVWTCTSVTVCRHSSAGRLRHTPVRALLETLTGAASNVKDLLQSVPQEAAQLGFAGDLLFIAVYAVSTAFFVPASILTLAAGTAYGVVHGTVLASTGATLGCALAFLVARYLARPLVEQRLQGNDLFQKLERKIPERGAKLVALLRLTPLVPFSFLNYACGLTSLDFGKFVLASWAGMLPATAAYVYLASAGSESLASATGPGLNFDTLVKVVSAAAILLVVREVSKFAQEAVSDVES